MKTLLYVYSYTDVMGYGRSVSYLGEKKKKKKKIHEEVQQSTLVSPDLH